MSATIRERIYVPVLQFNGVNSSFASLNTGAPGITEVTGRKIAGLQMDAATDKISGIIRAPFFLAPEQPLGVKVHYTTGSITGADTIDWTVLLDEKDEDDQIANASSALDTVIAQDTIGSGTAYINKWTVRGIRDKDFLTRAQIEAGANLIWSITLTATDVDLSSEKVWLLGIEFDFVRIDYPGETSLVDLPLTSIES